MKCRVNSAQLSVLSTIIFLLIFVYSSNNIVLFDKWVVYYLSTLTASCVLDITIPKVKFTILLIKIFSDSKLKISEF